MRKWHRWIMTVLCVLLTYWVGSGLMMALYDATDPTQVWAIEGGGPGARLTDAAKTAQPIPPPASLTRGITAALGEIGAMQVASVDLRMVGSSPRLQLAEASGARSTMRRFYADTGAAMSNPVADGETGARPPPNVAFRNYLKSWHRGNIAGLFGQFLGLFTGLGLIALTVTGTLLYFDLWKRRRAVGKPGFFWQSRDSLWRRLHRWCSIVSAVFLLNIAISGTILAWGEIQLHIFLTYHIGWTLYPRPTPLPAISAATLPRSVVALLQTSYQAAAAQHPGARIASVTLVERGDGVAKGVVILGGAQPVTLAYDATTGTPVRDWSTSGVQSGNGYFADWHQALKRLHRGDIIGRFSGRYIDMIAGLALLYLVVSSLVMYIDMFRRRATMGRSGVFW